MIPGGGGGVDMLMWGQRGDATKKRPTVGMYRRLLRFVGPYRGNLWIAVVLLLVSTALGLVWPQIVQRVLDLGLKEPGLLDELVVVLIAVLLVRAVVDGVRQFVMAWTGEKVIFDLRMAIVNHLQSMSLSFFNVRKTGDLMSHVTSDATLVHGVVTQTIIQVLGQVLTLVGGVTIIFLMNWRLALLTLVVAPPIGIIGQYLGRKIRDISRAAQDAQGEAVGVLQEALAEVRVVQAFTREDYEAKRFHEKLLVMFQKSIDRARIGAIMFPAIGFLGFASSIVVLWYGGHQVATGELTAGQLVAFLLYMGTVAARADRRRPAGADPLRRHDPREHPLRATRRHGGRDRGRGPSRQRDRVHHANAEGFRDDRRRARRPALGRTAAAHRDRESDPPRRAHPSSRRGHELAGQRERVPGAAGARPAHARPHHHRHRAPALDGRAGGSHPRARPRPHRRRGHARRASREERALSPPLHPQVRGPCRGGRAPLEPPRACTRGRGHAHSAFPPNDVAPARLQPGVACGRAGAAWPISVRAIGEVRSGRQDSARKAERTSFRQR